MFTFSDAVVMVEDSTDWKVGLTASRKKWEQIDDGDPFAYSWHEECGLCIVTDNLDLTCDECPADELCTKIHRSTPAGEVLDVLGELELPQERCESASQITQKEEV